MRYHIEMKEYACDAYEIASNAVFPIDITESENVFTNKAKAAKEMHRLIRQTCAANRLREAEGSSERHYYYFRVVNEKGVTVC